MDQIQKMLQTIINGQSTMKQELLGEIRKLKEELTQFKLETRKEFQKVHRRIDRIGKQLAYVEDDTPTREEFDELETKVNKLIDKAI